MEYDAIKIALAKVWAITLGATHSSLDWAKASELEDTIKILKKEADRSSEIGRGIIHLVDTIEQSNIFEFRHERATKMEAILDMCQRLQKSLG